MATRLSSGLLLPWQQTALRMGVITSAMATRPTYIGGPRKDPHYVQQHMEAKKVHPAMLAKAVGVNRSTIKKWLEKGEQIRIDDLERIAYALDVDDWRDLLNPPGKETVVIDKTEPHVREAIVQLVKTLKRAEG